MNVLITLPEDAILLSLTIVAKGQETSDCWVKAVDPKRAGRIWIDDDGFMNIEERKEE